MKIIEQYSNECKTIVEWTCIAVAILSLIRTVWTTPCGVKLVPKTSVFYNEFGNNRVYLV